MIFLDTETTGLPVPGAPLDQQPRIIELALIITDSVGQEQEVFHSLINPGIPVPEVITKITGLTDEDLKSAPPFAGIVPHLVRIFREDQENTTIGHNIGFDLEMIVNELRRIGWEHRFPYSRTYVDTVPLSGGKKLENWAKEVMKERFTKQSHRALDDVRMLIECWRTLA